MVVKKNFGLEIEIINDFLIVVEEMSRANFQTGLEIKFWNDKAKPLGVELKTRTQQDWYIRYWEEFDRQDEGYKTAWSEELRSIKLAHNDYTDMLLQIKSLEAVRRNNLRLQTRILNYINKGKMVDEKELLLDEAERHESGQVKDDIGANIRDEVVLYEGEFIDEDDEFEDDEQYRENDIIVEYDGKSINISDIADNLPDEGYFKEPKDRRKSGEDYQY